MQQMTLDGLPAVDYETLDDIDAAMRHLEWRPVAVTSMPLTESVNEYIAAAEAEIQQLVAETVSRDRTIERQRATIRRLRLTMAAAALLFAVIGIIALQMVL